MNIVISNYLKCREKIDQGSNKVHPKDFPCFYLILGSLMTKITSMEKAHNVLQNAWSLMIEEKLPETFFYQWLNELYEQPHRIDEFEGFLKYIKSADESFNLIEEIQRLFTSDHYSIKVQNRTMNSLPQRSNSFDTIIIGTQNNEYDFMEIQKQEKQQNQLKKQRYELKKQKTQKKYLMKQERMNYSESEMLKKMKEDEDLARKFQEQEEENFKKSRMKSEEEQTTCEICYVDLYEADISFLDSCGHIFHRNCLIEFFKEKIKSNIFPLQCPNQSCKLDILENNVKQILQKSLYQKYQSHTLKAYADLHGDSISWCPTANCGYMFFYQASDDVRFSCPQCKKQYCLDCRCQWHKEMTCKQYKVTTTFSDEDKKFIDFVKGAKFKQCPKCKVWVQKNLGCDHMTCKCKFEFCYKCGGVYMKCECMQKQKADFEARRRELQRTREQREFKKKEKKENQQKRRLEKERKEAEKASKKSQKQPQTGVNTRRGRKK